MKQSKSLKFLSLASALILSLLFLFQNCSDTGEEKKDESSLGDDSGFPFETEIDTISYMSCSRTGTSANPRAYYTFRAGAYTLGKGIGLSDAFIAGAGNAGRRNDILQSGSNNMGSYLQMSIRQRNAYQTVLGGSGAPQEGYHYYNFLDTLSAPVIADRLSRLGSGEKINYFSGTSGLEGKFLEGSLRFFEGETQAGQVRNYLLNDMVLGMTYSMPGADGFVARAPDMSVASKVYGKGYRMNFKLWGSQASGINRLLQGVTEMDLATGLQTGPNIKTWTCNPYDAYVIVRAQDAAGYCSVTADPRPSTLSASDRDRLEKLRRVLRVEDWWVDITRGCVVPKNNPNGSGGACYGAGASAQTTILYTAGAANSGVTACDVNTCPHYVSICTRN